MMRILLEFAPGNVDWIKLQSPASPPEEFVIDGGRGVSEDFTQPRSLGSRLDFTWNLNFNVKNLPEV